MRHSFSRFLAEVTVAAAGSLVILVLIFFGSIRDARADTNLTDCTTAGIQAALNAGGLVTLDCGPNPVIIPIGTTLTVPGAATLDGRSKVTLDGEGARRIISTTTGSALTLTNITLANGNAVDANGGGAVRVAMSATLVSINSVFTNNTVLTGFLRGGAIYGQVPSVIAISGSTIVSNSANNDGGGIHADVLTLTGSTVMSNTSVDGIGGITARTATIIGSSIVSNTAGTFGSAGMDVGVGTVAGSTIAGNVGRNGAGIRSVQSLRITDSTIANNNSSNIGGGIYANQLWITDSVVMSNTAYFQAGGIYANNVHMSGSIVQGNEAMLGAGGGIWVSNEANVASTFLASNRSGMPGKAIWGGLVDVTNSTIVDHSQTNVTGTVSFYASLALTNVTAMANATRVFSSVYTGTLFTMADSIVGGIGATYCTMTATLIGTNIVQDPSCGTGAGLHETVPELGPLRNNGGRTPTMAPIPGSPAIGAAGGCLPTDQRGAIRIAPCDIGAFETGAKPVLTSLSPVERFIFDPSFTMIVTGTGFVSNTVVLLNGSQMTTTVESPTRLAVSIPSSELLSNRVISVTARYGIALDSVSNGLTFTVSKLAQVITFNPLPDRRAGDPPFVVSGTASSGLPVSFNAAGACFSAGVTVTLLSPGACTVTGTQPGNETYQAADPVIRMFLIEPIRVMLAAIVVNASID